jgi:hypothetical protein
MAPQRTKYWIDEGGHDGATELAQEAYRLWQDLPARDDVLFYPIADLDLEPLRRVGHLADVFLFADWRYEPSGFDETIGEIVKDDTHDRSVSLGHDAGQRSFEVPPGRFRRLPGSVRTSGCSTKRRGRREDSRGAG